MVYQVASKACAAASNHNSTKKGSETVMTVQLRRGALLLGRAVFSVPSALDGDVRAAAGKATITVTAMGKKESAAPSVREVDGQLALGKGRKQAARGARRDSLALA